MFALSVSLTVQAQLQNSSWFVGQGSGLKFTQNGPVLGDSTVMGFDRGATTVSDSVGSLLFYSNGAKLYNRLHQPMFGNSNLPTSLSGHSPGSTDSLTIGSSLFNSVLAFNAPGLANKYYLFTHGSVGFWMDQIQGIYYQVIDMDLDGSLGGVESPANRVAYQYEHGYVAYKYAGVRHANGRDWWLVAVVGFNNFQTSLDSIRIDRFLFTPAGISDTLTTLYPSIHDPGIGEISVSTDGSMIAFGGDKYLYLTNFDRCSGEVGELSVLDSVNFVNLESGVFWYGVSFAPSRKDILYAGTPSLLYQYHLDTLSNESLEKNLIHDYSGFCLGTSTACRFLGQLQVAIDGNIYQTISPQNYWDILFSDTTARKLNVIYNADSLYPACVYSSTAPIAHKPTLWGLPNQVNWKLGKLVGSECDTLTSVSTALVEEEKIVAQLFPNPAGLEATLVLHLPAKTKMALVLFDAIGKEQLRVEIAKHSKYTPIDLTTLPNGFYSYRIIGANANPTTGKLIISR